MTGYTNILDDPNVPILIVDDNLQYSKVLTKLLTSSLGFTNISHASGTEEAYVMIQENPDHYKLLFVDFNFPVGDDGCTLIQKLKDASLLINKIAFLITADPSYEKLKQVTRLGAVGIVGKPFNKEQIIEQISKAKKLMFADSVEYF
jgi:response regulator of citrate/malate metabolism